MHRAASDQAAVAHLDVVNRRPVAWRGLLNRIAVAGTGHASASPSRYWPTCDTYSHLWPDSEDQTREAMDQVLGRPADAAEKAAK
jgi:hypothetical protein